MANFFTDKYVVVTGVFELYTRYELMKAFRVAGAKTATKLDKRIHFLIAGNSPGRRLEEAKHLGVRVIHEDELIQLLGMNDHDSSIPETDLHA